MSSDFQRQMPGGQSADQSHWLYKVHLDPILLALVCIVLGFGLMVLFSAAGEQTSIFDAQFRRVLAAMAVLIIAAQLPLVFTCAGLPLCISWGFCCWCWSC